MIDNSKLKKWVEKYLAYIEEITPSVHAERKEGYKFKAVDIFQKNFNIDAKDLDKMLGAAIINNNLVVGSFYFPRKMLLIFAKEYPRETRENLKTLFDEFRSVEERINIVEKEFDRLMVKRNAELKEKHHHFMGIRFLSILLGCRYPLVYNPLKPREWRKFCQFIDSDFSMAGGITSGKQYEIYQPHIEALRTYISGLPKIKKLKTQLTEGLKFHDDEFRWMTQDIIYVTAAYADRKKGEENDIDNEAEVSVGIEEKNSATTGSLFTFEADLENYVKENLENLGLGDGLRIYSTKDGTIGQQYTTPAGTIDILAIDKLENFVVIELKRGQAKSDVVGQIGGYMHWVHDKLATSGQSVRGIIIAARGNNALLSATKAMKYPIDVKFYQLRLDLK